MGQGRFSQLSSEAHGHPWVAVDVVVFTLYRKSLQCLLVKVKREGIATVPGSAFGNYGEGYLRLAYSNSYENIDEAMNRMEKSLGRLSRT